MKLDYLDFGLRWTLPGCVSGTSFFGSLRRALLTLVCAGSLSAISFLAANKVNAQVTILHSFGDGTVANDGASPASALIQAPDGNFYGTTTAQVTKKSLGTIFQVTPTGVFSIIYRFLNQGSGQSLLYYKGSLIGVSIGAGAGKGRAGKVFELTESAQGKWALTIWHAFTGPVTGAGSDGNFPAAPLILGSNGLMYGTTEFGGKGGFGTIYQIDPATVAYSILHNFANNLGPSNYPDTALFQAKDGKFYGGTQGEIPQTGGEIFKMTPAGKVTTFYTFPAGSYLVGPLIQGSDGNFYGCAGNTVFRMTSSGVVTVLHTFGQGTDGKFPTGVIFGPNGNLYGTTEFGGTADQGTVFEVATDASSYTVLHNFADGSVLSDGDDPNGLVLGVDNNLYGTTLLGGSAKLGTVFRISP